MLRCQVQTLELELSARKLPKLFPQLFEREVKYSLCKGAPELLKLEIGGLSAEKYIRITKTSRATATRDLAELAAKQALKKTGRLKGTRYHLNLSP